ncbi:glycosyltransferase [Blastococcus mobilis]|uniref:Glycosyltransferase involved in cell wall bisynthesis n=1 Tax=Blastococcus mobilis TaxID=1938746 RepID=A0A238YLR3_9ACTN|nr:glycosyltransferase [Blastococcus mobilis]SNR72095.1 Glycosyltransferase involved in cell wall bisynthesis [Blastococcus mobilis]
MSRNGCRVLYLDGYTVPDPKAGVPSSDAIGYGITASAAIRDGLAALGLDVVRPRLDAAPADPGGPDHRLSWILANYRSVLRELVEDPPDVIFCFHIFSVFPVEIRRMLLDLGLSIPIVGYTHGSHWDPTDTFRFETYPGMEVLDLANLHVLDRVLLVSEYMRTTLRSTIGAFNAPLAEHVDAHAAVVGLPLAVDRIDACRTSRRFPRPTVVFNHAPVSSKNPELFARVMARVLPHQDVAVLITRDFAPWQPGGEAIAELAARFPEQVILGRDLPLDEYFAALWAADLQVSTATHESLGVSTLEAMYTGNCCILPRVGSYPEICDGHPDVLYEPGEGPLEERLRWFLEHPEDRRAVAFDLQRLSARFHPRVVVQKIAAEVLSLAVGGP